MVLQLRSELAERWSPATANRTLSAVKQVCRETWRMRLLDADELQRICDIRRVPGSRLKAGRYVDTSELEVLLDHAQCQGGRRAARDVALLHTLFFGGLRRAEVASLSVKQLRLEENRVFVRVVGKGNKEREVPLPLTSTPAICAWLRLLESDGALYPSRGGTFMTPANVRCIVMKLARQAGVAHLTPHDGRRTFISYLFDANADVSAIQALAGHSNMQTTVNYDRRPERGKLKAVDKLPQIGALPPRFASRTARNKR